MTSEARPAGPRIMVGVNGSAASAAALCWALREATLRRAVLQVVNAWEPATRGRAPYAPGPWAAGWEADRHAAEALLAAAVRHAQHAAGQAAEDRPALWLEAVEGLPAKVLLGRACDAELLVLGGLTARPGGGSHQPVSPVALACLRAAPCPVVVVTSPALAGTVPPAEPVLLASRAAAALAEPRQLSRRGARAGCSAQ
jgi:nucleotide-binding universal stress UspA family protein